MTAVTERVVERREGFDARVLGVEVAEGLRAILREPVALFFAVLMPVLFFALFAGIFGGYTSPSGLPVAATMLATYGTFAVATVMMVNPGVTVADDRTRGWLRVKKVSGTPIAVSVAAKVIAALPYALLSLLAISAMSLAISGPVLDVGTWLRVVGVLLLGSLPFALLSLAVGFVASSNATVAILNAILFPMTIASGLWLPPGLLPGFVQAIAPLLPTYHLSQLAQAQMTGAGGLGHLVALLVSTVVAAALAGLAYRNLRV
ncbi:ABC transporter permease [Pseudonocardia humida]|uniref:ABC transporter permease n=1 Tax=Pseudonocardia humida TaxID=2800819 RepID=A0ABT0ZYS2_9PSEU|nr:ABC transporter permease [Pseudonocardia humida]MCO1655833.1 ABC transporter permease [Pseudonocardia humida]